MSDYWKEEAGRLKVDLAKANLTIERMAKGLVDRAELILFRANPTSHQDLYAHAIKTRPLPSDYLENLMSHLGEGGQIGEPAALGLLYEVLRLRMANAELASMEDLKNVR